MTPADINPYLSLLLSAIAIGGFFWQHLTSGGAKALKEVSELKRQLETDDKVRADAILARFQMLDNRVTKLEGKMETLPDRDSTHGLEIAMERLTGKLEVLEERLKPVDALSRRLQEILINQATARDGK